MSEEKNTEVEAKDIEQQDTEGQAFKIRAKNEDHLPPAQREATDDGSDDVEGHGRFKI